MAYRRKKEDDGSCIVRSHKIHGSLRYALSLIIIHKYDVHTIRAHILSNKNKCYDHIMSGKSCHMSSHHSFLDDIGRSSLPNILTMNVITMDISVHKASASVVRLRNNRNELFFQ